MVKGLWTSGKPKRGGLDGLRVSGYPTQLPVPRIPPPKAQRAARIQPRLRFPEPTELGNRQKPVTPSGRSGALNQYNLAMRRRKDVEDLFWPASANLEKLNVEMVHTRMTITARRFWQPATDLIEDANFLILKVDLAGTRIEDVHLGYLADSHTITIRGNRPESDPEGSQRIGIYQLEIYYGDFERVIALPRVAVDVERIEAALFEGILTVLIPKV